MENITHYLNSGYEQFNYYANQAIDHINQALEHLKNLLSKINHIAITTILEAGVTFGLYILNPHIFTWTAVLSFLFFSEQVNQAADKVNNLFVNFINNRNFPFYIRYPIGIGAALVLLHNIPDWMNIATFYYAAKLGATVNKLSQKGKLQGLFELNV